MKTSFKPIHAPAGSRLGHAPGWAALLLLVLGLPASPARAQTYSVLHHLPARTWYWDGETVVASGTMLFGTTCAGGISNKGTIFALGTNGTGFTTIKHFSGGLDGDAPLGLVISDTTLFGTTFSGGISNLGTVFRINTDGSGHRVLRHFTGYPTDGANCRGGLVRYGSTLYGATMYHGSYVYGGTIFKINTDGSGYAILKSFTGPDGKYPNGGLVLQGATLYGTTGGGGTSDYGTLFKVNTDGSAFVTLKSFTWTNLDGYTPQVGLVGAGTELFGTTSWSAASGLGTVFRVANDGGGFTVLKDFVGGAEGKHPSVGLLLANQSIFGLGTAGGVSNAGTIFQVGTAGGGFQVLKHFLGGDGAKPTTPLVAGGRNLYGMTSTGGSNDGGVVFTWSFPPLSITNAPHSQTTEQGSTVQFRVGATGAGVLDYTWRCNGSNVTSAQHDILRITNALGGHAGTYEVVVTDAFGAVTSSPAMLNVIPAVPKLWVPGIRMAASPGGLLNVECASQCATAPVWTPFPTTYFTNSPQFFFDLTSPLPPQRFYRVTAQAGLAPVLDLQLVPALTLTGSPGDKVRVDAIRQFGPTDAWFTLDTVTLTDASPLYFDTTAPGQPPRLYRLVPIP